MLDLSFRQLTFPGRAGELHKQADTSALVAELGDHYKTYHDFLADEVRKSGRPKRESFDTYEAWALAYERVEECIRAEATLRACRALRQTGDARETPDVPLVSREDQLVSVE